MVAAATTAKSECRELATETAEKLVATQTDVALQLAH